MRKFILIVLVVIAIVAVIAAYLVATTPKTSGGIRFPLSAAHRARLAQVPASAEAFAFIPTAAVLHGKLMANPVTRDPLLDWTAKRQLPRPWMLGRADVLIWKSGKSVRYLVFLDPLRAALVRFYLLFQSGVEGEAEAPAILINMPGEEAIADADLTRLLALTNGLPAGDVLVVQRDHARGGFPPIGRPNVTVAQFGAREVLVTSRGMTADRPGTPLTAKHPAGAIISGAFSEAPRFVNDLNRVIGANVSQALRDGGSVAIYSVNTGTLVPRPKGVFALPMTDTTRAQMGSVLEVAKMVGEAREIDGELVVSIDEDSMGLYLKDTKTPSPWPATQWTMRFNPPLLVPILESVAANSGLRLGLPRIHRAARNLRGWVRYLDDAAAVEAADTIEGGVEVLRVRVVAK
ncbi:MAG TPA: hypothetical protein VF698_02085 [Thermoanaerobaculia bacterium]